MAGLPHLGLRQLASPVPTRNPDLPLYGIQAAEALGPVLGPETWLDGESEKTAPAGGVLGELAGAGRTMTSFIAPMRGDDGKGKA